MKLYKFLQNALGTSTLTETTPRTETYQDLIDYVDSDYPLKNAPNIIVGGNQSKNMLDLLTYYTPEDANYARRKSILKKIMAKYYNYSFFTDNTQYFCNRLLWKLNEIMPTYQAKFNATISSGDYDALFKNGSTIIINRSDKGKTSSVGNAYGTVSGSGEDSSTDNSFSNGKTKDTSSSQSTYNRSNNDLSEDSSYGFESDYPQVIVNGTTDYNTSGSKNTSTSSSQGTSNEGNSTSESINSENTNTSGSNGSSNYSSKSENSSSNTSEDTSESQGSQSVNRSYSPFEIALAKERFAKLVYNIEAEIVTEVSKLFMSVNDWNEDAESDIDEINVAIMRVITNQSTLNELADDLEDKIDELIEEVSKLEPLPDVGDEYDILMVNEDEDTGELVWKSTSLPNVEETKY